MVKTSTQMKNMIEDWIKIVGVKYQNSTDMIKPKNQQVDWQFVIGQGLHITKISNRNDRIHIHYAYGFSDEIKNKLNLNGKINSVVISEVNGFLISSELHPEWVMDNNQIVGLNVNTYIDEQELTRPTFFRMWDKVIGASDHVMKIIALRLQIQSSDVTITTNTSSKGMYQ